jgi:hypothetical protein
MAEQRLQLRETIPGVPGEIVCAGCQAGMVMAEPEGDSPAGALVMTHTDSCGEVKRLTAGAAA